MGGSYASAPWPARHASGKPGLTASAVAMPAMTRIERDSPGDECFKGASLKRASALPYPIRILTL